MKKILLLVALVLCVIIGGSIAVNFRDTTENPFGGDNSSVDSSTESPGSSSGDFVDDVPLTGVQLDDTSIIF